MNKWVFETLWTLRVFYYKVVRTNVHHLSPSDLKILLSFLHLNAWNPNLMFMSLETMDYQFGRKIKRLAATSCAVAGKLSTDNSEGTPWCIQLGQETYLSYDILWLTQRGNNSEVSVQSKKRHPVITDFQQRLIHKCVCGNLFHPKCHLCPERRRSFHFRWIVHALEPNTTTSGLQ